MKSGLSYKQINTIKWVVLSAIVIWFLLAFLIVPNLNLFRLTLFPDGKFDTKPLRNIVSSKRVLTSLQHSFILGVTVAISTNVLGIFQVLVLDYYEIRGRKWLNAIYHLPLVINGMVLVLAYNFILGSKGILTTSLQRVIPGLPGDWILGFGAVFLQLTFSNTKYHITFVRDALQNLDYQTVEAARNMGASPWSTLRKVVLPTLTPSILAATILNFNMALSAFASPKILGGRKFETINPLVFTFSQSQTTKNYAVIMSVFLGLITFTVLAIFSWIEKRKNVVSVSKVKTKLVPQKIKNPVARWIVTIIAHLVALIQLIPAALVVVFSFMNYNDLLEGKINVKGFNLYNYARVFSTSSGVRSILVSLCYALVAAVLSVAMILLLARWITRYKNKLTAALEKVLLIPWFLPSTLIALGILFTYNKASIFTFGKVLSGTVLAVLVGYLILRIVPNMRIIKAAYLGLDRNLEDAAKNLGASGFKTYFKVLLPILAPTALSATLLSFIGLFAEFNLTVFLFHPLYIPLGVVINNATNPEAAPDAIMLSFVYAVVIMVVYGASTILVYGRSGRTADE